jgi:hypothetical protein
VGETVQPDLRSRPPEPNNTLATVTPLPVETHNQKLAAGSKRGIGAFLGSENEVVIYASFDLSARQQALLAESEPVCLRTR